MIEESSTPAEVPLPGETPRHRRRARRIGCGVLIALVALCGWLVLRDDPPPDDSDLILPYPAAVPEAESVYGAILECWPELPELRDWEDEQYERLLDSEVGYIGPWESRSLSREVWGSSELVAEMDSYYSQASTRIDGLARVLGRSRAGWPGLDATGVSRGIQEVRDSFKHLRSRALYRRLKGDHLGASRDLELGRRLGESLLVEGPRDWLDAIVGCALVEESYRGWESQLHDGELDSDVEAQNIQGPPLLDRHPEIVARCLRNEYRTMKYLLTTYDPGADPFMDGPPILLRTFFKPNRTLSSKAAAIRHVLTQIDLLPHDRSAPEESGSEGALRRAILRANSGELVLANGFVSDLRILGYFDRLRMNSRAVRTLVALRAYERTRGALPADLTELVAAFPALGSVPIDPYSGAPFGYDPARRILWSVGEDGVDGGGDGWEAMRDDPEAEREHLPDWIWPIPALPEGG